MSRLVQSTMMMTVGMGSAWTGLESEDTEDKFWWPWPQSGVALALNRSGLSLEEARSGLKLPLEEI